MPKMVPVHPSMWEQMREDRIRLTAELAECVCARDHYIAEAERLSKCLGTIDRQRQEIAALREDKERLLDAIKHSASKDAHEFEVFQRADGMWIACGRGIGSGATLESALAEFVVDHRAAIAAGTEE
jgi:hypothetical protein